MPKKEARAVEPEPEQGVSILCDRCKGWFNSVDSYVRHWPCRPR